MEQFKQHHIFRLIAKILVVLILSDFFFYAKGQSIECESVSKLASHLAPTSSFQLPYRTEYGRKNRDESGMVRFLLEKNIVVGQSYRSVSGGKKIIYSEWFSVISKNVFAYIVDFLKNKRISVRLKNKHLLKFVFPFLLIFSISGAAVAKTNSLDMNTRQNAYVEWVNHALENTSDKENIRSELLNKLRYSGDPAEISGAAVIMKKYWKTELGNTIFDDLISSDRKKEILLVSSLSTDGSVDISFLSQVMTEIVNNKLVQNHSDVYTFALDLIKGELLKNPDLFTHMDQITPLAWVGKMNILIQIIQTESHPSIIRESAIDAFLKGFSNQELMISFIKQSNSDLVPSNSLVLPFNYITGHVMITGHNDKMLADCVMSALKSRLAVSYLEKRSASMHFNNEFIERNLEYFFGTGNQAYAAQILPLMKNDQYPEETMNMLYPDIAQAVKSHVKYLFGQIEVENNHQGTIFFPKIVSSKESLPDIHSKFANRKLRAIEMLKTHGAVYSMLTNDETSRLALREIVKDNTLILLHIYLDKNSSNDDRDYASRRLFDILKNGGNAQLKEMHQMASRNSSYRNGLIQLFASATDTSIKNSLADIYFRSESDFAGLIQFYRELSSITLLQYSQEEYAILKEASESEIRRRITLSVLGRKIGVDKSNTDLLLFHVDENEIAGYKTLYQSLDASFYRGHYSLPEAIKIAVNEEFTSLIDSGKMTSAQKFDVTKGVSKTLKADISGMPNTLVFFGIGLLGLSVFCFSRVKFFFIRYLKKQKVKKPEDIIDESLKESFKSAKEKVGVQERTLLSEKAEILKLHTHLESDFIESSNVDFNRLGILLTRHFNSPFISAEMENKLLKSLINLYLKKSVLPQQNDMIEDLIRKLLQKIYVQKFVSSTHNNHQVSMDNEDMYATQPQKSLVKNICDVLTSRSLIDSETINSLGAVNHDFKVLFANKFRQTNTRMRNWIIKGVLIQFLLIVVPSFLIKASSVPTSIIIGWGLVALFSIMIRSSKLGESENTSLEVDKTLKLLLHTISSHYGFKTIPETKNISQGIKARWHLIEIIFTGLPVALAVLIIKPIFFVPFLIFYAIAMYIIFKNIFHDSGLANALENYERRFDDYRKNWNLNDYLVRPHDMIESARNSHMANEDYTIKSKRFTFIIFFLVAGLIPLISMIFGFTMYGIALSGYLSFLAYSFQPIKRMTKGIYHSHKLKRIVKHVHSSEIFKWEKQWETMRERDLDAEQYSTEWEIEAIEMKEATLLSPSDDQKFLLNHQTFSINRHERVILAANSGAGKSETGRTLSFKRPLNKGDINVKMKNKKSGKIKWVGANPHHFDLKNLRKRISFITFDEETGASLRELLMMSEGISPEEWMYVSQIQSALLQIKKIRSFTKKEEDTWNRISSQYERLKSIIESSIQNFINEHTYRPHELLTDLKSKILSDLSADDIRNKLDLNLNHFSSGQRKRIKLALNLKVAAQHAEFVILDEPFASVQGHQKDRIGAYLKKWQQQYNIGLIIIDHHDRKSLQADKVISLSHGEIIPYLHFDKQFEINQKLNQLVENPYDIMNMDFDNIFLQNILNTLGNDQNDQRGGRSISPSESDGSVAYLTDVERTSNVSVEPLQSFDFKTGNGNESLNRTSESRESVQDSSLDIFHTVEKAKTSVLRLQILIDTGYFNHHPIVNMQELIETLKISSDDWSLAEVPMMVPIKQHFIQNTDPRSFAWAKFLEPKIEFDLSSVKKSEAVKSQKKITVNIQHKKNKNENQIVDSEKKISDMRLARSRKIAMAAIFAATPFIHSCDLPEPKKDDNAIEVTSTTKKSESILEAWKNARREKSSESGSTEKNISNAGKIMGSMEVMGETVEIRAHKGGILNVKLPHETTVKKGDTLVRYSPMTGIGNSQIFEAGKVMSYEEDLFEENKNRAGVDISQGEILSQEIKTRQAKARLQALKQKTSSISIKAEQEGMFYHQKPHEAESNSVLENDTFGEGEVLGYFVQAKSKKKMVRIKFQTDNIFKLLKKSKNHYYVEVSVNGEMISVPFNVKSINPVIHNLDYEISVDLEHEGLVSGQVYQVMIHESQNVSEKNNISENIILKQNGILYYPESLNYNPVIGGIVSGVSPEMTSGSFSAKALNQIRLGNPEQFPQLVTLNQLKFMYEKRIGNLKKVHGDGNPALVETYTRLTEINKQIEVIHYAASAKKIETRGLEEWMVTEFNLRNKEYFPSTPLMQSGRPFLRMVNTGKIYMDVKIDITMADKILEGISTESMELKAELQKMVFPARIVSRNIDARFGMATITLEIIQSKDDMILKKLNLENFPAEIRIIKKNIETKGPASLHNHSGKNIKLSPVPASHGKMDTKERDIPQKSGKELSENPLGGLVLPMLFGKKLVSGEEEFEVPHHILGIYPLFQIVGKYRQNQQLREAFADYVVYLLQKGYSFKNRSKDTDLLKLKHDFHEKGIHHVALHLEKIFPKDLSEMILKRIVEEFLLYNRVGFSKINPWPLPAEPIWADFNSISNLEFLKIINDWLPWVSKKIEALPDDMLLEGFVMENKLFDHILLWITENSNLNNKWDKVEQSAKNTWLAIMNMKAKTTLRLLGIDKDTFSDGNTHFTETMHRYWNHVKKGYVLNEETGEFQFRKALMLLSHDPILAFFIEVHVRKLDGLAQKTDVKNRTKKGDVVNYLERCA